jgi:NAD(P)H-hydrate epimerase
LDGQAAALVKKINQMRNFKIAIDLPSGLFADLNKDNSIEKVIQANLTLTFQWPKLAFMFADFGATVGHFKVLNIGLYPTFEIETRTENYFLTKDLLYGKLKGRKKFSHKNSFGHLAIYAGSRGKMGAAILCSKAALRSGAGLVTTILPFGGYPIIQTAVPEAMCIPGELEDHLYSGDFKNGYTHVAIGPGIGRHPETEQLVKLAIQSSSHPLILDADALNFLAENPTWMAFLPGMSILTPHPGEFDRLAGKTLSAEKRYHAAKEMAIRFGVIVVLKGAHTQVALPNGDTYFNSTGNPGMATAGSGDVLTGVISGLLAQGYTPEESALLGVYLHGLAGDLALKTQSQESLIAGDLIDNLGLSFQQIENS